MFKIRKYCDHPIVLGAFALLWLGSQMAGCAGDSYTAKGAASWATTGAVAGAVGAAAGAMSGSQGDRQIKQQREAGLAKLREDVGDDAFEGLEALADCRHDASLRQASKAQQSKNPNYALAGLWLEVLNYGDMRDEAKARGLFPTVVEKDRDIKNEAQAEDTMRKSLNELMNIRQEYKLPRVCK